jgi:hypothetical protein
MAASIVRAPWTWQIARACRAFEEAFFRTFNTILGRVLARTPPRSLPCHVAHLLVGSLSKIRRLTSTFPAAQVRLRCARRSALPEWQMPDVIKADAGGKTAVIDGQAELHDVASPAASVRQVDAIRDVASPTGFEPVFWP